MSLHGSVEEKLSHLEDVLCEHICFLIDEGDHRALNNLVNHLGTGLNVSNSIYESMWELSELLIDEFGYQKCPSCQWAMEEGERHLECEKEIKERNAPLCIFCQHPVLEGEEHSYCHQQLDIESV